MPLTMYSSYYQGCMIQVYFMGAVNIIRMLMAATADCLQWPD